MGISRLSERLNRALFPVLGPAQVGPYDDEHASAKPCPMCGLAMAVHEIERTPGRPTRLHCPD